ncbi:MAG: DEAD/DEAH box helicase, partial [Actinomycetia bacterium]|nr:DEAD/DEAH box helicase [Actinomycetes bacterium]
MTRELFDLLSADRFPQVEAQTVLPGRPGRSAPLPADLHLQLADTLAAQGITRLWTHQAECWEASRSEDHFMVTTGTASGKSLCFNLPVVDGLLRDPHARAMYLYPTKALAQDQLRRLRMLAGKEIEVATYDGDTPSAARQVARQKARVLLTNPDMIHLSLLPHHERWDDFFFNLRYVVIDEAHTYRGVFGSNVANVLRRLRRVASLYGAEPRFILASATIRNAREHARHLTGLDVRHISGDGAPVGARKVVFWQPPLVEDQANVRRSSNAEAAELLGELVRAGVRSICFTKSRRSAELIYQLTVDRLKDTDPRLAGQVSPYRAGYTPEQRRSIETMLFGGQLLAVVSTSALELGIDIGALDAAITVGYPGTMASLWQQWGRAGRGKGESLAIFVAGNDALEQFFVKHPDELLTREVEAATVDFANPFIHSGHLAAAAYESPLIADDERFFGPGLAEALERGVAQGLLRRKGGTGTTGARATEAWYSTDADFPAAKIGLRSTAGEQYTIVEEDTGDIVGTEGAETAFSAVHPGAVYLHMGDTYLVTKLDLDQRVAFVRPFRDNYHTIPRRETDTRILSEGLRTTHGPLTLHLGEISVSNRVVAFQKKRTGTDEVLGTEELDLPRQEFVTEAMWFTIPPELLPSQEEVIRLPGAIHAVEHALIALLPLFAMCDRWDIGGLSTPVHSQTEAPTIFVYDGHAGGVGISRQGFERFAEWVHDARNLVRDCRCENGCPSCIQSPKCGNWNEPLDKAAALRL